MTYLARLMGLCTVERVPSGHRAVLNDSVATFVMTGGPNEYTEEMARKAAVFFAALKAREDQLHSEDVP